MGWKSLAILAAALALVAMGWCARRPAPVTPAADTVAVVAQATKPTSVVSSAPAPAATPAPAAVDPTIPDDPAVAAQFPEDQTPAAYYRRLRAERRDPAWAPRAESGIGTALAAIPNLDGAGSPPRVTCATTLCEVHGTLRRGLAMEEANDAMQALQGDALRRRLGTEGMEVPAASFGGKADVTDFTLYVARKRP